MRFIYELTREEDNKLVLFEQMMTRQKIFKIIKAKLVMALVVAHSYFDKSFILYTDALEENIEVVLY